MLAADQKAQLSQEIGAFVRRHHRGQRLWSFAHHLSTFGAGIISLVVASITQVQSLPASWPSKNTTLGVLSLIAAVLTFLATRGAFERKWRTNRKTRTALEILRIKANAPNADDGMLRSILETILTEHENGMVGHVNQS